LRVSGQAESRTNRRVPGGELVLLANIAVPIPRISTDLFQGEPAKCRVGKLEPGSRLKQAKMEWDEACGHGEVAGVARWLIENGDALLQQTSRTLEGVATEKGSRSAATGRHYVAGYTIAGEGTGGGPYDPPIPSQGLANVRTRICCGCSTFNDSQPKRYVS